MTTMKRALLTLIRKVRSTSTLMSSLLLFAICQVFVVRFSNDNVAAAAAATVTAFSYCTCTDWVSNVKQTNYVTKGIALTTEYTI